MPQFIKHLNPARARLRDALEAKAAAVDDMAVAQTRIDRLQSVIDSVEPARAALAALDSEHSAALDTWARVTGSPLPKIDADKRSALVSALADAEAQAAAATAAMENMQADARVVAAAASAAHRAAWIAAKLVLVEESESTLPALRKAIDATFAAKRQVDAARQAILAELQSDDPAALEVFRALGDFDKRRQDAETIPFSPDLNEHHGEWRGLAASLLQSPEAALGDAPDRADAIRTDGRYA